MNRLNYQYILDMLSGQKIYNTNIFKNKITSLYINIDELKIMLSGQKIHNTHIFINK